MNYSSSFYLTTNDTVQNTWCWSCVQSTSGLTVTCNFGGGASDTNIESVLIPKDSSTPVPFSLSVGSSISVKGTVTAYFNANGYIVTFAGSLTQPDVVRATFPSELSVINPLIVAASLS